MPSSVFFGMQHLNNNVLCAISFDQICQGGEIIELCVLPLDQHLGVHPELALYSMGMRPNFPENYDSSFDPVKQKGGRFPRVRI